MSHGSITPFMVRYAYRQGVFPMGDERGEIAWYEPRIRAVFSLDGVHVSRSLRRRLARTSVQWVGEPAQQPRDYDVRFDTAFEAVMRGCLRPADNWITEELIRIYTLIHQEGWGHCAEVWQGDRLVGGTYGLAIGGCFCAESMFHRETDASKIALWAMVEQCKRLGFTIFDAQIMNPHLASLGAVEMPQTTYLRLLREAAQQTTPWSS